MKNQQMPEQPTTAPTCQAPTPPPGPDIGVSRCVMSIARELDRLPAGHYVLAVDKPAGKTEGWQVSIDRVEKVREMDIVVERSGQVLGTHLVVNHDHKEKRGTQL